MQETFERLRLQSVCAFVPPDADFAAHQPPSAFSATTMPPHPWTLLDFENCLAAHTSHVNGYASMLCMEAAHLCTDKEVQAALGVPPEALAASAPDAAAPAVAALLTRGSLNARACLREMVLNAADAFAGFLETFAAGEATAPVHADLAIPVRSAAMQCPNLFGLGRQQHRAALFALGVCL